MSFYQHNRLDRVVAKIFNETRSPIFFAISLRVRRDCSAEVLKTNPGLARLKTRIKLVMNLAFKRSPQGSDV